MRSILISGITAALFGRITPNIVKLNIVELAREKSIAAATIETIVRHSTLPKLPKRSLGGYSNLRNL